MPSPFSRLPSSIITCGAALCASAVLLLQNTTSCALRLQENLYAMALYSSARDVPKLLHRIGDVFGLEQLNNAEKLFADRVSALLSVQLAESTQELLPEPQPQQDAPTTNPVAEPSVVDVSQTVLPEQGNETIVETPSEEVHDTEPVDTVRPDDSSTAPDSGESPSRTADRAEVVTDETPAEQAAEAEQGSAEEKMKSFRMFGRLAPSVMQGHGSLADALKPARGSWGGQHVAPPQNHPSEPSQTQSASSEMTPSQHPDPGTEPITGRAPSTIVAEEKGADEVAMASAAQAIPEPSAQEPPASVASQQQPPPPAVGGETPPMRYRIQMVGDSMMEGLGYVVHSAMRERKGLEFILTAKQSTGLSRPDYFNWPVQLRETMALYKPDLVIFFFGANDSCMPVYTGEGIVPITQGKKWREAYAKKMAEVVQIVHDAGADLIWIQMPALGTQRYKHMHEAQIAQREFCEQNDVPSLLTDDVLSGEWGRFEAFGDFHGKYVRLRTKDTAHLTGYGNKKLVEHLMPIMEEHMARFYAAHPERRLSEMEVARIRRASLVVVTSFTSTRMRKKKRMKKTPDPML